MKKNYHVKEGTAKWIEKGARDRKIWPGEFLDIVALSWNPNGEAIQTPVPEKITTIAEELELTNGLLKIAREDEGLPEGFVRAKITDAWKKVDWKKLEALSVEVQGLKRDKLRLEAEKLKEETGLLHMRAVKVKNGLPMTVRNELAMEDDTASPDGILWCSRCKVTAESREEIESHKKMGCSRYLEPYNEAISFSGAKEVGRNK